MRYTATNLEVQGRVHCPRERQVVRGVALHGVEADAHRDGDLILGQVCV